MQGHVDGVGEVVSLEDRRGGYWLTVRYPGALRPNLVQKGSITVNGVSLTIAALSEDDFGVALIPHTYQVTNLSEAAPGVEVNLECDILGKYVLRGLETGVVRRPE